MKKINLTLISIIVSIVLTSCSTELQDNNGSPKKYFRSDNDYPYCYDADLEDCILPSLNCMETVIITPPKETPYNSFKEAVNNGPSAISSYFNTGSWSELFPNIDATDLSNLRSGSYDLLELTNGDIIHYLAGPTETLSKSNVDFVLVVDVSQ